MSYDEYGSVLGVGGLDPSAPTIDGIHLWHVLDDSDRLHDLLCKDITTWGQLRTLIEYRGAGLLEAGNGTYDRARAAAKAIEAACESWRYGRGAPVDRGALLDSGCVSERFIDEVSKLAQRLDGDAEAILHALDSKEVSNWRSDNTERLRDYFESEGYLSPQEPLRPGDVRVRVMAAVSEELHDGLIDHDAIDRIVGTLYADQTPATV